MEKQTLPPANISGLANPSPALPRSGVVHESTATPRVEETTTSIPSGTSELLSHESGSPAVVPLPANTQGPQTAGQNEHTLQQPLIPVVQSPTTETERTTVVARPATTPIPMGPPSSPKLPHPTTRPTSTSHTGSLSEKLEDVDTLPGIGFPELHRDSALRTDQPLPVLPQARLVDNGATLVRSQRRLGHGPQSSLGYGPSSRKSNIDWIVPLDEKRKRTVTERLQPTLEVALIKRERYVAKARSSGWALNVAIGLQVLFSAITTGLSAVGTTGRSTAIQTTIFGALSTLAASYLARARGSKEPELSILRVRDLEHFIRDLRAFQLDHGQVETNEWDSEIDRFRHQLEEILERRRGPPSA